MKTAVKITGILVLIVLTLTTLLGFVGGGFCMSAAKQVTTDNDNGAGQESEHPVAAAIVKGVAQGFGGAVLFIIGICLIFFGVVALVFEIIFGVNFTRRLKGYRTRVMDWFMLVFNVAAFIAGIVLCITEKDSAAVGAIVIVFAAICETYAVLAVVSNKKIKRLAAAPEVAPDIEVQE